MFASCMVFYYTNTQYPGDTPGVIQPLQVCLDCYIYKSPCTTAVALLGHHEVGHAG